MESVPHADRGEQAAYPERGLEGAVMYRPPGEGDATDAPLNQAAPGRPGPPLEAPSTLPELHINPAWPESLQASVRAMHARVQAGILARAESAPAGCTSATQRPPTSAGILARAESAPAAPPVQTAMDWPAQDGATSDTTPARGAEGAEAEPAPPSAAGILDDSAVTARALAGLLGPLGQRVFSGPGGMPLTVAQRALDGTWTDPTAVQDAVDDTADALDLGRPFNLAPGQPVTNVVAPRPPEQPQLPLRLPEPWHRPERQLDLFKTAFKWPSCTCKKGTGGTPTQHTDRCQAQVHMSTAQFITAESLCWAYVVACFRAYPTNITHAQLAYAERRAREVALCCTKWHGLKCKGCQHIHHYATTTPCNSRTCPVCGRRWSRKAMAAMYEWQKAHPVVGGEHPRDDYMHTFTEQKPPTLTLKGLRQSINNVLSKAKNAWEKVLCNLPRKPGWLDAEKYAAAKLDIAARRAASEHLPCRERAAERRRLDAESKALWQSQRKNFPGPCKDAGMVAQADIGILGGIHVHALRRGAYHYSDDIREAAGGTWTKDIKVAPKEERTGIDWRTGEPLAELDQADALKHAVCEVLKYVVKTSTNPGRRSHIHPMLAVLYEMATGPDAAGKSLRLRRGYGTMKSFVADLDATKDDEDKDEHKKCPKCGGTEHEEVFESYEEPTMPNGGWCLRPTRMKRGPPGGGEHES